MVYNLKKSGTSTQDMGGGTGFGSSQTTSNWNSNRVDPFYGYGALNQEGMRGLKGGEAYGQANFGAALAGQNRALAGYEAMAAGQGPSLATEMMRKQTAQNIAAQQSMQAQAGGAGAFRGAQLAGSAQQVAGAQSIAEIRAQEQQAAMAGAAGLSSQMAGQGLQQQLGYGGMLNQAQIAQMQAGADFQLQQRALQEAERSGRAQRRMGWANFGVSTTGKAVEAVSSAVSAGSDERMKTNIQPAGAGPDVAPKEAPPWATAMAGAGQSVASGPSAGMANPMRTSGQYDASWLEGVNDRVGSEIDRMQAEYDASNPFGVPSGSKPMESTSVRTGQSMGRAGGGGGGSGGDMMGSIMGMVGGGKGGGGGMMKGAGAAMSDERAKQSVQPSTSPVSDLAASLQPVAFDYQPGAGPPGRRVGVLAQDLERTPAGAALVTDTPQGKMVDTDQAALAGLAVSADQEQRLRKLEQSQATPVAAQRFFGPESAQLREPVYDPREAPRGDTSQYTADPRTGKLQRMGPKPLSPEEQAMVDEAWDYVDRTTYMDETGRRRLRDKPIDEGSDLYMSRGQRRAIDMEDAQMRASEQRGADLAGAVPKRPPSRKLSAPVNTDRRGML